jgi:ryanodine receptor 2
MYTPNPICTDHIELPADLLELTEKIAENVHENWSAGRIADGWQYAPQRDDVRRLTPCLVPYDELSEEEKEFDRVTAMQTLKFIMALGYKIVKE